MYQATRRLLLQLLGVSGASVATAGVNLRAQETDAPADPPSTDDVPFEGVKFSEHHDRVFLGGDVWANPMEDWRIEDGRARCTSAKSHRNVHCITKRLENTEGSFVMQANFDPVEKRPKRQFGFRIGIQSDIDDHRADAFAAGGIVIGQRDGQLVVGKQVTDIAMKPTIGLRVEGRPENDQMYRIELHQILPGGRKGAHVWKLFPKDQIVGNVAIAQGLERNPNEGGMTSYAVGDWTIRGDAFVHRPERAFGPILWTMYTLHDPQNDDGLSLRLTALLAPIGQADGRKVELQTQVDGQWQTVASETVDPDAFTATFERNGWDGSRATDFRVVYHTTTRVGSKQTPATWEGTIRANPVGRPLRGGMLTCQNDYAFPYAPVADNLVRVDPDMLYFSGDQLYEGHGGYGIIRRPADRAILNYLRKFYQFGWAFREAMRDRPTLCIPDDHDVFQGNIWGEGGAPMDVQSGGASSNGGYIEPAKMVNVVHRTNTSHHPRPHDPEPCLQDISVYYGTMLYGGVSFAILGDRQWKSGPQKVDTGSGRADHVLDPNFDTSQLDREGLELLGSRQEAFLDEWVEDWSGHEMKVLLSQTVFAWLATHHGGYDGYRKADLDCGGWPQTARDRAIDILRRGKCLHVNGDQHLASVSQYGVRRQRDSNWSFCVPAIAAGYPRWWRPDEVGMSHENRPMHGHEFTGEYTDGLGNYIYVYAHGNPEVATEKNRYEKAHQKGSGFGLVTIDSEAKTYRLEAFRFLCDASKPQPEDQFPGWPLTIHRDENAGENRIG